MLCKPCSYSCLTCNANSTCETCNDLNNRVYNSTSSKCDCLIGYYDVGNNIDSMCYPC